MFPITYLLRSPSSSRTFSRTLALNWKRSTSIPLGMKRKSLLTSAFFEKRNFAAIPEQAHKSVTLKLNNPLLI